MLGNIGLALSLPPGMLAKTCLSNAAQLHVCKVLEEREHIDILLMPRRQHCDILWLH